MIKHLRFLIGAVLLTLFNQAHPEETGGVFGPVVNAGHRAAQYRAAMDPDAGDLVHRIHYEQALDDDVMWRVVTQLRNNSERSQDFDYVQAELFRQLPDLRSGWAHGVRFDITYRDDNRPSYVGLNWMHDVELSPRYQLRMLAMMGTDFGENARSGVIAQTRAHLLYRFKPQSAIALSLFSRYGRLNDSLPLDAQRHEAGPTLTFQFGNRWQLLVGYLHGLTESSRDHSLRLWLTRAL